MTEQEALAQATQDIEDNKPMYKNINGENFELSDSDYEQAIEDRKNYLLNQYLYGYIEARQLSYKAITEQLDQLFWAVDSGLFGEDAKTSQWYLDIQTVKTDNPKPSE